MFFNTTFSRSVNLLTLLIKTINGWKERMSFDSKHFQKKTEVFNKKVNLSEVD